MLRSLLSKWIIPASTQIWLLVVGAFGVLLLVVKGQSEKIGKQEIENKNLEAEVQKAERLQNVEINTDRDAALKRLKNTGRLRDD